jgi:hypothetical protein
LDGQFSIFDLGAEPLAPVDRKTEKPRLRLTTRAGKNRGQVLQRRISVTDA